jgi:hypothetical protein
MKPNPIKSLDWPGLTRELDKEGYALLPNLLSASEAKGLAALSLSAAAKIEQQSLSALELGKGTPGALPEPLATWQEAFYEMLSPIANRWNETMGVASSYPLKWQEFLRENTDIDQQVSHATLSRLIVGDYQELHQSTDGTTIFPLQLVVLLSDPETDFSGGEFVMTEQRPRMQSRPMVLPMRQGDAALITVAHRPFNGTRGYYRVNLKHAISKVRTGERVGLEMTFHNTLGMHANG